MKITGELAINDGNPIRKIFIPYGFQKLGSSDIDAVKKAVRYYRK